MTEGRLATCDVVAVSRRCELKRRSEGRRGWRRNCRREVRWRSRERGLGEGIAVVCCWEEMGGGPSVGGAGPGGVVRLRAGDLGGGSHAGRPWRCTSSMKMRSRNQLDSRFLLREVPRQREPENWGMITVAFWYRECNLNPLTSPCVWLLRFLQLTQCRSPGFRVLQPAQGAMQWR